jgi:hypothetical protein
MALPLLMVSLLNEAEKLVEEQRGERLDDDGRAEEHILPRDLLEGIVRETPDRLIREKDR